MATVGVKGLNVSLVVFWDRVVNRTSLVTRGDRFDWSHHRYHRP